MTRGLTSFLRKRGLEITSLVVAILIWQLVSDLVVRDPFILPSFYAVVLSFYELRGLILMDTAISLMHFAIGLAAGIAVGVPIGAIMGWFRTADRIADPLLEILRPIPPLAWIPFAIVWFHLTHVAAGFVVFIGTVFPILINTYDGFRGVTRTIVDAAKVLGCKREWDVIRRVAFPFAFPSIAAGIRIGMGVGWMCVVAAEMFGVSKNGLGYRLFQKFYFLHQMDYLMLYMIILGLIALFLDRIFRFFIEEKLFRWRKGVKHQTHHCFCDRNYPRTDARIMPSFYSEVDFLHLFHIHTPLDP